MLLALRDAIADAGGAHGASVDLDVLARRLGADREVVRATLAHAIERGWIVGVSLDVLPVGCGTTGCQPQPASAACRRCPLAS